MTDAPDLEPAALEAADQGKQFTITGTILYPGSRISDVKFTGCEDLIQIPSSLIAYALAARSAPEAGKAVVKPLEWRDGPKASQTVLASTPWNSTYAAWEIGGSGCWTPDNLPGRIVAGGIDAAKAAAQADFEQRILSALASSPASEAEAADLRRKLEEHQDAEDKAAREMATVIQGLRNRATAAERKLEEARKALEVIASSDDIENALDPARNKRVARQALSTQVEERE